MNFEDTNITAALLPAYLDGSLEPDKMQQVRDRLAVDADLQGAYAALCAQEEALYDLGAAVRQASPAVDVLGDVMAHLQSAAADVSPLEMALLETGNDLRAAAPTLDVSAAVMQAVSALGTPEADTHLETELVETGNEIRAFAPRVDVSEEVMEEVSSGRLDNITSIDAAKGKRVVRRRQTVSAWSFAAAAAACILALIGFVVIQMAQPQALRGHEMAVNKSTDTTSNHSNTAAKGMRNKEGEPLEFKRVPTDEQKISMVTATPRPKSPPADEKTGVENQDDLRLAVDVDTIIKARREVLAGKDEALARLARWGALDPDEVRRLIAEGILSPKELAGISRFLPNEDALALLRDAVTQYPDDPMLHFALARNLMDDPGQYDLALQELARFRELTPDNSLSYYMDAQIRLAQGDFAGALQSIEYASAFQSGSAYALENAQYHSAALEAAGFPHDVAQMLAAFNAGSDEYGFITQLGNNLLSYGAYYESIGDYETAMAIYKGVNQLGLQVNQGADFSNEMLAGLDSQRAAVEAIDALAKLMNIPGGAYTVEVAYTVLMQGMDFFLEYTSVFENLIGNAEAQNILQAVQQIMQVGDIRYLNKP